MNNSFKDYSPDQLTPVCARAYESAWKFRERRHDEWTENYELSRMRVQTNRFTQRQSVCLPIMKSVINTVMSKIAEPPNITFFNKDNDKQVEIYMNGVWEDRWDKNKGMLVDTVDKKNNALYGRGIKIIGIKRGQLVYKNKDNFDVLIDKNADPVNIDETASYVILTNIQETKAQIETNPYFDKTAVKKVLEFVDPLTGKASDMNQDDWAKGNRMERLGYSNDGLVATTKIERKDFYIRLYSKEKQDEIIYYVPCISNNPVACLPLSEVIGKTTDDYWDNHFIIDSWADDIDGIDVWSTSLADIARDCNKLMNIWWSQLVENRTLRNLSMFFYNSSNDQFIPQTFNPYAWGFYPVPGNPNEMIMPVTPPDLTDTLEEIGFVKNLVEQCTAATATLQGAMEKSQVTLGEVQITLNNAQERIQSIAPYYCDAWKSTAEKAYKIIEGGVANGYLGSISLSKQGARGNTFLEEVDYKDLITPNGYEIQAIPTQVAENLSMNNLQKLNVAIQTMPENAALKRIYKQKILEATDLSPEHINEIKQEEEKMADKMEEQLKMQQQLNDMATPPIGGTGQPPMGGQMPMEGIPQ